MNKNLCPLCDKKFERLMGHIRKSHPSLYIRECDKAIEMFESGMSLREIGTSSYTHWSFGSALSIVIKNNVSDELIQNNRTKKISEKLKAGYELGLYNTVGRGRKRKGNSIYNPVNAHPTETLIWQGKPLIKKNINAFSDEEIKLLKEALISYIQSCDFMKYYYAPEELKESFKSLMSGNIPKNNGVVVNKSSVGSKIYKYFFPNMLKVIGGHKGSVIDAINNKDSLNKILDNRLGKSISGLRSIHITKNMIIQGAKASGEAFSASQFKPLLAKHVYNEHVRDGYDVLDYSCGFGGRLLGLMATGKKARYFGYEPCEDTYNGLINMSNFFNFPVNIKKCGSEEDVFDNKFDFIFSSPPYFDTEKYSDSLTQCYNKYPDYLDWLERYWRQTVKNIKQMSKNDSVFAINVGNDANERMRQIDTDMNKIIVEEGFVLFNKMPITSPVSPLANTTGKYQTKTEYIYFYKQNLISVI